MLFLPRPANAGFFSFLARIFNVSPPEVEEGLAVFAPAAQVAAAASAVGTENRPPAGEDDSGEDSLSVIQKNAILAPLNPVGMVADDVAPAGQIFVYTVRPGDTLSSIAKSFHILVNTIRWANDLTISTVIRPGQTLIILPIDSIQHTVARGETIEGIVKKYRGDIDETLAFNGWPLGYEPRVGEVVIVPNGEGEPLTNSSTAARGTGGPVYTGYYIRPINGGRISQGLHGLNAKDFATYCNAPILASARGIVLVARSQGWYGGYGLYVVIAHPNGTQTLYAHMSRIAVSVGWNVAQGQVVGYVGSTGNSTGCHVHLEIRGAEFTDM
ncbi:MAG: M23 family metallopeptidase [Candidatus Sungbacteria bacterium]|uniref:M23 family metallopeptidase n=1 Tax=Candidatus Sungiibacteriota bacterium TaxID=2750080 RepID=A0A932YWF4_9BACT|nr:M23 family metallopeptidase [Candidatus Sungbacteria bacterium]